MRTTSFVACAGRVFGKQVSISHKGGKAMKNHAGLNDRITVFPTRLDYVTNQDNGTVLYLKDDGTAGGPFTNTCGGMTVWIPSSHPLHDRAFVLFNMAILTDVTLEMIVEYCDSRGAVPYKINMK
jgi:hypothetical protein